MSEVFGAALWTADVSFEFARAGATGVHMHWVSGRLHLFDRSVTGGVTGV